MVAVIVLLPTATAVASPWEPDNELMVAAAVLDEPHVTWVVRSCVDRSEYVPVAVNRWVAPTEMAGLAGSTEIEARMAAGAVTLTVTEAVGLGETALVAMTVHVAAVAGAVYAPDEEMEPQPDKG
jgi:hypothetical protein